MWTILSIIYYSYTPFCIFCGAGITKVKRVLHSKHDLSPPPQSIGNTVEHIEKKKVAETLQHLKSVCDSDVSSLCCGSKWVLKSKRMGVRTIWDPCRRTT